MWQRNQRRVQFKVPSDQSQVFVDNVRNWETRTDTDGTSSDSESYMGDDTDISGDDDAFDALEASGLSVKFPLPRNDEFLRARTDTTTAEADHFERFQLANDSKLWEASKTPLKDIHGNNIGTDVELSIIRSVEVSGSSFQRQNVTMTDDNSPEAWSTRTRDLTLRRWMHIPRASLRLDILQAVAMSYPFPSERLKEVIQKLLADVERRFKSKSDGQVRVESGTVIRYIGELPAMANTERRQTEPVIFTSCPYLSLEDIIEVSKLDGQAPEPLLHHLYGYRSEYSSTSRQVIHQMEICSEQKEVHINQIWSLMIGSGKTGDNVLTATSDCLITYSSHSAEVLRTFVHASPLDRPRQDLMNVTLIHGNKLRFHALVGHDWTYVDIVQYAMCLIKMAPGQAGMFDLVDAEKKPLSADIWLKLVSSGSTNLGSFHIRKKPALEPLSPLNRTSTDDEMTQDSSANLFDGAGDNLSKIKHSKDPKRPKLTFITQPFFQWRTTREQSTDQATNQPSIGWEYILDEVQKDSSSIRELYGSNLNKSTFRCTAEDLWLRNNFWITENSTRDSTVQPNEHEGRRESACSRTTAADDVSGTEPRLRMSGPRNNSICEIPRSEASDDQAQANNNRIRPVNTPETVKALVRDLLQTSRSIASYFLPENDAADSHDLIQCIWRSLDTVFRQLNWAAFHGDSYNTKGYIIRDFDLFFTSANSTSGSQIRPLVSWSECKACVRQDRYSVVEAALNHLHSDHFPCPDGDQSQPPFDDPCYVWILHTAAATPSDALELLPTIMKEFLRDLRVIETIAQNAQALVARGRRSINDEFVLPMLPKNFLGAFGALVNAYMLQAKQLSLMNCLKYFTEQGMSQPHLEDIRINIQSVTNQRITAVITVKEFLKFARESIMMVEQKAHLVDIMPLEGLDINLLALAFMVSVQNQPVALTDNSNVAKDTDVDEIYQAQLLKMRIKANQRPKRRLFLDLSALEEELDAVGDTVERQGNLVINFLALIAPDSLRKLNSGRLRQFTAERQLAEVQERTLKDRHQILHLLRERAMALRAQVKQTIEVLEEDHGKAIRVFTIVTLFFLPMSFISSFLGMNTTDIRDTELDQRFFWVVSIPLTAVVVILALTYGYKGDDINEWIRLKTRRPRDRLARLTPAQHKQQNGGHTASLPGGIARSATWELWQQPQESKPEDSRFLWFQGRRQSITPWRPQAQSEWV